MLEPYLDWTENEGVPIIEDFAIDMLEIESKPWARFGVNGAICHLKGRDDFLTTFLLDLAPAASTAPIQHIYEEVVYVLSGHGSTTVETADRTHTFEWGPRSLFTVPLNAKHRHFNGSGREPARLALTNNLTFLANLFRSEKFIFNNPHVFEERWGGIGYFAGEGELIEVLQGRHQWETNFVPDLGGFELKAMPTRGAGGTSLRFILGDGSIGCHCSEIPPGTYKKGHRHMNGVVIHAVTGQGYSLLWYEGDKEFVRTDWKHGCIYSPPDKMFHQHFNISEGPSRYLAIQMGSVRYPMTQGKRDIWAPTGMFAKKVEDGGMQIEYDDEDPRIFELWKSEMSKAGLQTKMESFNKKK
ncbi:MAG: cupin domain-containing protein [Alphaproteobacteria bacterium]|nr:cupin domain-containing protein [Alphaproteobacteria bacterium]